MNLDNPDETRTGHDVARYAASMKFSAGDHFIFGPDWIAYFFVWCDSYENTKLKMFHRTNTQRYYSLRADAIMTMVNWNLCTIHCEKTAKEFLHDMGAQE